MKFATTILENQFVFIFYLSYVNQRINYVIEVSDTGFLVHSHHFVDNIVFCSYHYVIFSRLSQFSDKIDFILINVSNVAKIFTVVYSFHINIYFVDLYAITLKYRHQKCCTRLLQYPNWITLSNIWSSIFFLIFNDILEIQKFLVRNEKTGNLNCAYIFSYISYLKWGYIPLRP